MASLLWDFGLLDMGLRIWIEKLMLVLHMRRLDDKTLARKIYEEQVAKQWPGLAKEAVEICQELCVESVHSTELGSKAYRAIVAKACHKKNEERIRKKAEGKIKWARIPREEYGKKGYIEKKQLNDVRQTYRTRFSMLPFAGNYSHDRRFANTDWLCQCRIEKENEAHLLSGNCHIYGKIREKYGSFDNDETLVNFFTEILAMRDVLEGKEQ